MAYSLFYSSDYVASVHGYDTTRKAAWIVGSLHVHPVPGVTLLAPASLPDGLLERVHDTAYIESIRTGRPRVLAQSQDFIWDPQLWPMVCATNAGVVAAALTALREGIAGSLSSGLHHARHLRGDGYCTFNGLILAAYAALDAGARRILILDLDAHCGGGTSELIAERHNAIHHLDISVDDYDRYIPSGSHTLDVITEAGDYLSCLDQRLQSQNGSFDLCLFNAGMDPYEGCAVGGLAGITQDVLRRREEMVFAWCRLHRVPIAFVMAGGYIGTRLSQETLINLHRLTIETAAG